LPTNKLDTLVPGAIAPGTPRNETTPGAGAGTLPPLAPAPAPRAEESAPPARSTTELAARLVKDTPPTPSLRLAPAERPRVPAEIAAGYEALRAGDLREARRSYAGALAADPSSLDAQLGLATIEGRLGNAAAAAVHYRRALDLDPRNATALAGLASIADMSQPEILEGQLRADIGRYPQSAALHFALGNLYASRQRWEEAQGAYFEALRIEPASADTLYNLAVAMDHMRQSRLAADYYRRALDASRGQAAQFDPAAAQRRLAELRP
jgi:Tfp pilus assembly protein PilF